MSMRKGLLLVAVVGICFWITACKATSTQGHETDFTPLDSIIQSWVSKGYYPGASICVVKNDTVIFQKNYGNYTLIRKCMWLPLANG